MPKVYVKKTDTPWRKLVEEQREDGTYRRCNKCDETTLLCTDNWKRSARGPSGFSRYCRACDRKRNALYARRAYLSDRAAIGKVVRANLTKNRKYP